MKIEVNNVYQKKSISKLKIGIIIGVFLLLLLIFIWRLYYERMQTANVNSFAGFLGLYNSLNNKENLSENKRNPEANVPNETKQYIPNFSEKSMENINSIYNLKEDGQKIAYLTFDDGPSQDVTTLILDILKEEKIFATFFVVGTKAEQNSEILKRIYEEGHYIANHGYSHIYSKIYVNPESVLEEYNKCETIIQNVLKIPNYSTHLFRFPRWFCWWSI